MSRTDSRPVPGLGLASLWRGVVRDLFNGYRPERHYMRGPGPKWHAKHDPAPAATEAMPEFAGLHVQG